ncbi:MAG TPA: hypothetical protein EYQ50_29950 [Verrucomicrobiales bacterium]|nr:hypothetical protein [Verrucomicrobiales bacterium]HIL72061.1 hypothetical protein [Verrucomicrobiota bacterium]
MQTIKSLNGQYLKIETFFAATQFFESICIKSCGFPSDGSVGGLGLEEADLFPKSGRRGRIMDRMQADFNDSGSARRTSGMIALLASSLTEQQ